MGTLFKKKESPQSAKSFFSKIIQIWKKYILEQYFANDEPNPQYIDDIHFEEAYEHLKDMLVFFEIEYGPRDVATAECQLTFALIMFKTGNVMGCLEYLQKCQINF